MKTQTIETIQDLALATGISTTCIRQALNAVRLADGEVDTCPLGDVAARKLLYSTIKERDLQTSLSREMLTLVYAVR